MLNDNWKSFSDYCGNPNHRLYEKLEAQLCLLKSGWLESRWEARINDHVVFIYGNFSDVIERVGCTGVGINDIAIVYKRAKCKNQHKSKEK